jgi:lipopolysaccharide export system permease protein
MFRLIDRYLIREVVPYLLLSLLLLTAIIFAHEASRFSELLVVASRNGLPMQTLWRVMGALIPGILVFTLPISLLIGTLVGLGRLSGDSEIVAMGAGGVSRLRMLMPVVALSLVVAGAMVGITFNLLPRSIQQLTDLKANQSLIFQGLNAEIKPRVFEESIPQKVLYIEDIDRARNIWRNVFLVDLGDETSEMKIVTASFGSLRQGERSEMPELYLQQGGWHQTAASKNSSPDQPDSTDADGARASDSKSNDSRSNNSRPNNQTSNNQTSNNQTSADNPAPSSNALADSASDKDKKKNRGQGQGQYTSGRFGEMTLGIEVSNENKNDAAGIDQDPTQVEEMGWSQLISFTPPEKDILEWKAEIHKRLALPTACLVFALLGVGFGISNVRTGRSFGLILGLAFTICYYLLALSGQHYAISGKLPVWMGIWLANITLGSLAVVVILLQRRPGSDPMSLLRNLRHIFPSKEEAAINGRWSLSRDDRAGDNNQKPTTGSLLSPAARRRVSVSRIPQLLDKLVLADLARFFFYILGGFSALFVIITLFQLLDYITRNRIDWSVVINYLVYLLPMIVNYVTPLAVLVAVMVTFGLLQKTSQVVALKASGQSIYRLAAPALLASIVLSAVVFFNQDYILPFTNRRQNSLRYLIRKGQEPPQTFYQTTNQWIFGIEARIFNYSHFDPSTNSFARLNVIDLSREPFSIKRRLYARKAWWDDREQQWVLENGWERRFEDERPVASESFKERRISLAEQPEYFKKDSRGATSLTLTELRRKIADLQQSGFDVLDLRIALQSKIAFPLACLVMVIVALPFSFSVGKRGALYGVAIGMAIGLVYWGLLSLFEQMGRYEMLPPMLAAWGPNMLFGAGGLYLFLTSRT